MARRKRMKTYDHKNFIGNVSQPADRDMTDAEFSKMMLDVSDKKHIRPGRRGSDKDVKISIRSTEGQRLRITFRIYNSPDGNKINVGDKARFYPMFDAAGMKKRVYFVCPARGGYAVTRGSSNILVVQHPCNEEFEYFKQLFNKDVKCIEADWKMDNNYKIPYIEVGQ